TTLQWSFFEAFRTLSPNLRYTEEAAVIAKGRPLMPSELGTYSSHFELWSWFLRSNYQQILILEDDVLVDWGYLAELCTFDLSAAQIPFLRLYAMTPGLSRKVGMLGDRQLVQYLTYVYGAQAYILTRLGATRLIAYAREVRYPIDDLLDRTWDH